ncbi:hypothetical protein NEIFLAOT_00944 [Neisseria flavescens NRL30031/H210]|uniref:Uncharacterized protein n=1 Tax=Neisseria flavescens NRL30031/H210 TaxID=546264 RepID=C0ELY1_NEIFL|nr:hypothetical protein NEIFLAOT_00944 [Neisseria flavescens NRL30031/H210]
MLTAYWKKYSGLNLNQDKATKPQTVQIVRQGEATPYWFKFNPLWFYRKMKSSAIERLQVFRTATKASNFIV